MAIILPHRRAGVAMIVALSLPMLLGATALCVDTGFWYQQQESLQSAADAAALAAARNNAIAANSNATVAVSAGNTATANQFGFTATTLTLQNGTANGGKTTITSTAGIPRGSFFARKGGAMLGIAAGFQYASATAEIASVSSGPNCTMLLGAANGNALYANGGAKINAANCGAYVGSSACNANNGDSNSVAADPAAQITFSKLNVVGCVYANTNGGAYVGGANGNTSVITQHAATQADPLAAMGAAPPWPTTPTAPVAPSGTTYTAAPSLGYNTFSGPGGDCTYMGSYTANCELYQGNYSGMTNLGVNSLVLNENTTAGTTNITGGFSINANNFLKLNASTYNVSGGMSLTDGGTATLNGNSYNILGGTTFQNGTVNLGIGNATGNYYFTGTLSGATAIGWGLNVSAPAVNFGPGNYYFNGGATFPGSNPTVGFGQGTYLFSAYTSGGNMNTNSKGATSNGAFNDNNANITFTGGTYYFNGGISLVGNSHITFGPGIYYVENGDLNFGNGSTVSANGATFVLEGNASYQLDGGSAALNLSAPTSNCVAPASYPQTAHSLPSSATTVPNATYAPYDGTNGEGICDVLIYQARGDATADNVSEGANSTLTGIIYAPSAALSISGGATLSSSIVNGSSQTLALIQDTLSLTGSGTLNLSVASNDQVLNTQTSSSIFLIN